MNDSINKISIKELCTAIREEKETDKKLILLKDYRNLYHDSNFISSLQEKIVNTSETKLMFATAPLTAINVAISTEEKSNNKLALAEERLGLFCNANFNDMIRCEIKKTPKGTAKLFSELITATNTEIVAERDPTAKQKLLEKQEILFSNKYFRGSLYRQLKPLNSDICPLSNKVMLIKQINSDNCVDIYTSNGIAQIGDTTIYPHEWSTKYNLNNHMLYMDELTENQLDLFLPDGDDLTKTENIIYYGSLRESVMNMSEKELPAGATSTDLFKEGFEQLYRKKEAFLNRLPPP